MAQKPTPSDVVEEIKRLRRSGMAIQQIARELGTSFGAAQKYSAGVDIEEEPKPEKVDRIEQFAAFHRERFLELRERFQKWIGDTDIPPSPPKGKASKRLKALGINDVHTPFHNEEALSKAIRDNRDADEVWAVGDLFDLFSFSRYPKSRVQFSAVEEFQAGRALIRTLAENFKVVRVMHGNHDDRFIKYLQRCNIPPDILEFFRMMHPDFLSPLAKVCSDFKNVVMMEPKRIDYAEYPFIHQMGDCVLSHAERFSKVPGKTPADVLTALKAKLEPMGVVNNFKVLAQAHTHCAGKIWGDYGVVTIEMGCLAKTPDYDGNPRLMGRKPVIGYTVFVQDNGVTSINESNFIQLA